MRANADTPEDARRAREFGAEGIGLVRTEHMFFARRSHPDRARDDHGRRPVARRAARQQAPAVPARRLHRDLPGHGRAAGHDPAARPAAARVPGQSQGVPGDARGAGAAGRARHQSRAQGSAGREAGQDRRAARGQPDARPPRLPPRDHLAGDLRHAGAGHHGGGLHGRRAGREGRARDHDPAHRHRRRDEADLRATPRRSPTACWSRWACTVQVHGRHHDRGAAGGPDRRQDRPGRRVLLVRDQRPHPDDVRLQPRRRRQVPARLSPEGPAASTIRSRCWTRRASAS